MTNEEAIKYLIKPIATSTEIGEEKQKEFEAYNMAIKALSAEGGDALMNEIKNPYYMREIPSEDGSDLINREDAMNKCKNAENELTDEAERKGLRVARFIIGELPSANRPMVDKDYLVNLIQESVYDGEACVRLIDMVDRPTGEWINEWKDIDGGRMYGACCSVCHAIGHSGYNYCPSCGARMENTK